MYLLQFRWKKADWKLTVRFLMNRKTFWVCCGPLMISGKQAASWEVIRSWGSLLWKAAPSTPNKEKHRTSGKSESEHKTRDNDYASNSFLAWRTSVKLCLICRLISLPFLKKLSICSKAETSLGFSHSFQLNIPKISLLMSETIYHIKHKAFRIFSSSTKKL